MITHVMMNRFLIGLSLLLVTSPAKAEDFPAVTTVEAQPLLAQVRRVATALESLGQPLPPEASAAIEAMRAGQGEHAVREVQRWLDPVCLAAVEIDENGVSRVISSNREIPVVEQGWRAYLVKVINRAGATGMLRIDSPNARPLPFATKAEVDERWLGLLPFTAQPLRPNLSGLGLEYTVVQVSSRDAGKHTAEIVFRVEGGQGLKTGGGPVVRQWNFAEGTDGWIAANNCKLAAKDNSLRVTIGAEDPFFTTNVSAKPSKLILRFWATFDHPGVGQVFWWTRERKLPDGGHQVNFQIEPGRGKEYEIRFDSSDDDLAGLRIDPGNDPGTAIFDWISLTYETDPRANLASARIAFLASPSIPVTFKVAEADGSPATACFVIRDAEGRVYPSQAKRLAPDFFFQTQIYRSSGETVHLPPGRYTVVCSRGPESLPETRELVVGEAPTELSYTVKRWIDPFAKGWVSGDHHIHAAGCLHYDNPTEGVEPSDMMRHILGEDLKVGCCLTWGPCFDYQKRFFTGKPDDVSQPPYLLRYDVEVSGFGSHASGHLNLLNLREQMYPGGESKDHWPTLGLNTLRWAKRQGAICGPAHSGIGLMRSIGRVEGAMDPPGGIPSYNIPAYDGIGANEFIVDVTHEVPGIDGKPVPAVDFISTMNTSREAEWTMWYHVLNCGFRVRASGETDFPCMTGERVGVGRVYASVDGELSFERWVQAIANGRSYVSDGSTHLMDFTAETDGRSFEVGKNGSEIRLAKPGKATFHVKAAVLDRGRETVPVELIVNSKSVASQNLPCDGKTRDLTFTVDLTESSWVALRVTPSGHTNPFFVVIDDQPIRVSKASAQWCIAGVDQCWKTKQNTYAQDEREQARSDYEHARKVYQRILEESPR